MFARRTVIRVNMEPLEHFLARKIEVLKVK